MSAKARRIAADKHYRRSLLRLSRRTTHVAWCKAALAKAWVHFNKTLVVRKATRANYIKWANHHKAAIKGRKAAALKAAKAKAAAQAASKKHSISVSAHIAAIKRRAAARLAAIKAHKKVQMHAMKGYMMLPEKK